MGQYTSTDYVSRLEEMGARISTSATGSPYDKAKAESFFKNLKREKVYLKDYQTFAEAEANLGQCIDAVYNTKLTTLTCWPRCFGDQADLTSRPIAAFFRVLQKVVAFLLLHV